MSHFATLICRPVSFSRAVMWSMSAATNSVGPPSVRSFMKPVTSSDFSCIKSGCIDRHFPMGRLDVDLLARVLFCSQTSIQKADCMRDMTTSVNLWYFLCYRTKHQISAKTVESVRKVDLRYHISIQHRFSVTPGCMNMNCSYTSVRNTDS